jgi:hypothetical protein
MSDRKALLTKLYVAFNDRDVGTLAEAMHPDVSWPNFLEGGRVEGREALSAYRVDQFKVVRPEASPIGMQELSDDRVVVRLHYVIRALDGGGVWTDEITNNTFTFEGDQIIRMDWGEPEDGVDETDALIVTFLDLFNRRDIEGAVRLLHPDVNWPDVFDRERLIGRDAVAAMWSEQFKSFDAEITLLEMTHLPHGGRRVRISYVVRTLEGKLFTEEPAVLLFKMRDGLIGRMDAEQA